MIRLENLTKTYRVPIKKPGLWGSVSSLWNREYREVKAVDSIGFEVADGERIGFLGPNGAGKTTTLKMLTGLLWPTSGRCEVDGFVPQQRDTAFLKRITLVMGQKQQLLWDLPASDTFALNKAMFDLDHKAFTESLGELTELLELGPYLDRPVRSLSLGERMRCELAAALLHRPKVLFLDEPTIGMDVEVQAVVRRFVLEYNRRHGATIILTSHDMSDVSAISKRIILIDKGVVRFDGTIEALQKKFGTGRRLVVRAQGDLTPMGLTRDDDGKFTAIRPPEQINQLLAEVLKKEPAAEVTVADPPLEDVLRTAFGTV